jgi:hypothetical protein
MLDLALSPAQPKNLAFPTVLHAAIKGLDSLA